MSRARAIHARLAERARLHRLRDERIASAQRDWRAAVALPDSSAEERALRDREITAAALRCEHARVTS